MQQNFNKDPHHDIKADRAGELRVAAPYALEILAQTMSMNFTTETAAQYRERDFKDLSKVVHPFGHMEERRLSTESTSETLAAINLTDVQIEQQRMEQAAREVISQAAIEGMPFMEQLHAAQIPEQKYVSQEGYDLAA